MLVRNSGAVGQRPPHSADRPGPGGSSADACAHPLGCPSRFWGLHKVRRKAATNSNQKPRVPRRPTSSHKRQVQTAGCDQQWVGASCWRKQGPVCCSFFASFSRLFFMGCLFCAVSVMRSLFPSPRPAAVEPSHICPLKLHLAPSAQMCRGQVGHSSHLPGFSALCHVASAPADPQLLSLGGFPHLQNLAMLPLKGTAWHLSWKASSSTALNRLAYNFH